MTKLSVFIIFLTVALVCGCGPSKDSFVVVFFYLICHRSICLPFCQLIDKFLSMHISGTKSQLFMSSIPPNGHPSFEYSRSQNAEHLRDIGINEYWNCLSSLFVPNANFKPFLSRCH